MIRNFLFVGVWVIFFAVQCFAETKIFIIEKSGNDIIAVKQGLFVDGKFVQNGICWTYSRIKFNETITRSDYKNGVKLGPDQSISRGEFSKPLEYIITRMASEPIESSSFSEAFFKYLTEVPDHK